VIRRPPGRALLAGATGFAVMLLLDWIPEGHVTVSDTFQALVVGAASAYAVYSLRPRS
jgi:peptidoglycan/LPS O-acetylase OafA/YrhL